MDNNDVAYTHGFYETFRDGSRLSAGKIIPEALRLTNAQSVVDIGCGVGTWLHVAQGLGIKNLMGVDGDYVNPTMLEIDSSLFVPHDLKQPFKSDRQFDLVMSLEVAEHLPPEYAKTFVDTLTGLGPVVLFSAAIPFQNGTLHLNEQFPEYWAALFRARGYVVVDCIRRKVWDDKDVEPWYAQNALIFVKEDCLSRYPLLVEAKAATIEGFLSLVHPKVYRHAVAEAEYVALSTDHLDQIPLTRILTGLPTRFVRALTHRVSGRSHKQPSGTGRPTPSGSGS